MSSKDIPSFDQFFNPVLKALRNLGGSATIDEMVEEVSHIMDFSEEQRQALHSTGKRNRTEVDYRTAWARTYLKKFGLINNSSRGVWAFTQKGLEVKAVDPSEVTRFVRNTTDEKEHCIDEALEESEERWKNELMETLMEMSPNAFERLSKRLLREAGMTQVIVTGKSGDNGIDGKGIMKIGLISFHILFQCKRHQSPISVSDIRDFGRAMQGRAEKGIFITTSRFTESAQQEATRDGATPIELINGEELMDLLKTYNLGVESEIVQEEKITIDKEWFRSV